MYKKRRDVFYFFAFNAVPIKSKSVDSKSIPIKLEECIREEAKLILNKTNKE